MIELKLLLACGGSGGHISPAIAMAEKNTSEGGEVLFVGPKKDLGIEFLQNRRYNYKAVSTAPLPRKISFNVLASFLKNFKAFFQSRKIMKEFEPDVVLGTGSYASGAPVLAASWLDIPVVIHEQNSYPGLTNRLLASRVDKIAISYPQTEAHFQKTVQDKIYYTGNPIRSEIKELDDKEARKLFDIPKESFVVMVMGGSQGAKNVNDKMLYAYNKILEQENIFIFHITGKKHYEEVLKKAENILTKNHREKITFFAFYEEIEYIFSASDLFVGRAGATTLAEITVCGLPAILIPYPHAVSNHQNYNAEELADAGAAKIIREKKMTSDRIAREILKIFASNRLSSMSQASLNLGKPCATENLMTILENLAEGAK